MIEKVRSIAIKLSFRIYKRMWDRAAYRPSLARRASAARRNRLVHDAIAVTGGGRLCALWSLPMRPLHDAAVTCD
jgi:hypothetical protein